MRCDASRRWREFSAPSSSDVAAMAWGAQHVIATQVWWGYLILKAVYAMATGDEEARKNEAKNA